MTPDDAREALAGVNGTEERLAERMHWPFSRHASFGVAEALMVLSLGLPRVPGIGAMVAGVALVGWLVYQDKRRHGMFVSGWHGRRTKALMLVLLAVLLALAAVNARLRPSEGLEPATLLVAGIAWAVCTALSMWWEKLYRAELREQAAR